MLTFRATWVGFFTNIYNKKACGMIYMSTSNKIISTVQSNRDTVKLYLDTAAELSKIDRKNHHQVTEQGVPLVYDMMVTVSAAPSVLIDARLPVASGIVYTAPNNWQTRNAVRMAHFTREDLRKESGVSKNAIGKYAKTMRLNLNSTMYGISYRPTSAIPAIDSATQRLYATADPYGYCDANGAPVVGQNFNGGVWDYSQLSQVNVDAGTGAQTDADPFYLNVCGGHSTTTSGGPYTYIGVIQGYNQRRQTVLEDSTVTPGGDTQFINNESPFFRVPQQDVSEDKYVEITLDEQDNPPYDRNVATADDPDAIKEQPCERFTLTSSFQETSFRVQAPLGLVEFELFDLWGKGALQDPPVWTDANQCLTFEIEVLGTYEM